MRALLAAALAAALAVPGGARAHGAGGVHARGTIKTITADEVVLTTKEGDQTFALGAGAAILRGGEAVRPEDVRAGERAVVHARREGQRLKVTELRLAPAAAAPAKDRERPPTRR